MLKQVQHDCFVLIVVKVTNVEPVDSNILPNKSLYANPVSLIKQSTQEYYNMLKENSKADEYWANYQAALAEGNTDMATWWKEQWDAEVDALDEAQEEMLSLTEEWAEAMKAVVENNMAKLSDTLEKSLTNGLGFDKLMDDFDKLNERQEEFLTKTNQIYETNKLMRTANKALDETDNSVAKQKLKNFIEETKSL